MDETFINFDPSGRILVVSRVIKSKQIEEGETEALFANPQQEYTRQLLAAIPKL